MRGSKGSWFALFADGPNPGKRGPQSPCTRHNTLRNAVQTKDEFMQCHQGGVFQEAEVLDAVARRGSQV